MNKQTKQQDIIELLKIRIIIMILLTFIPLICFTNITSVKY